jgi:cell division protein FtsL
MSARYGNTAVYGNLAYDLTRPGIYAEPPQEEATVAAPPKTKERTRAVPVARPRYAVAPAAVIGFGLAAVLLVFSLMGRVQLVEASDEAATLSGQLSELQEEQSRLLISYESTFDLNEVDEYAKNTLGMQKAQSDQVYYIGGETPDKAVVLAEKDSGFAGRVLDFLDKIGEFFR